MLQRSISKWLQGKNHLSRVLNIDALSSVCTMNAKLHPATYIVYSIRMKSVPTVLHRLHWKEFTFGWACFTNISGTSLLCRIRFPCCDPFLLQHIKSKCLPIYYKLYCFPLPYSFNSPLSNNNNKNRTD